MNRASPSRLLIGVVITVRCARRRGPGRRGVHFVEIRDHQVGLIARVAFDGHGQRLLVQRFAVHIDVKVLVLVLVGHHVA